MKHKFKEQNYPQSDERIAVAFLTIVLGVMYILQYIIDNN